MIKNLLLAYNGGPASNAALGMALHMARKYDAHLTGVLAHGVSKVSRNIPAWFSAEIKQSIVGALSKKANEIEDRFRQVAEGSIAPDKLHWIEVAGDPDQTIADYAMLYDITIVGQFESLVEADELELHPDRIASQSGRPVLLVPKGFDASQFNENAVLAWDGHRTAARAFAGAIPVLATKDLVNVVTVEAPRIGTPLPGIDISTVLSRHGIRSNFEKVQMEGNSVSQTLLSYCEKHGAGLLVMGAYEHSRLKQDLIGGVTNKITKISKVPILMSH